MYFCTQRTCLSTTFFYLSSWKKFPEVSSDTVQISLDYLMDIQSCSVIVSRSQREWKGKSLLWTPVRVCAMRKTNKQPLGSVWNPEHRGLGTGLGTEGNRMAWFNNYEYELWSRASPRVNLGSIDVMDWVFVSLPATTHILRLLTPSAARFGNSASKEVIRLNDVSKWCSDVIGLVFL